jgi:hypothetical protein
MHIKEGNYYNFTFGETKEGTIILEDVKQWQ